MNENETDRSTGNYKSNKNLNTKTNELLVCGKIVFCKFQLLFQTAVSGNMYKRIWFTITVGWMDCDSHDDWIPKCIVAIDTKIKHYWAGDENRFE